MLCAITLYNRIRRNPTVITLPRIFIFDKLRLVISAKLIIKLINSVADG